MTVTTASIKQISPPVEMTGEELHAFVFDFYRHLRGDGSSSHPFRVTLPSWRALLGLRFSLPSLHCHIYI